jgi:hypothetical protein
LGLGDADLKAAFAGAMTPAAYERLLGERHALHETHRRRAHFTEAEERLLGGLEPRRGLVITEPWCGDSLAILPVLLALFERIPGSELRIVRRDEHPALMDRYLTHGGRAVPIFIVLTADGEEAFHWGPRPAPAQAILERHRGALERGEIEPGAVHADIRAFYGADRGRTIIRELIEALSADAADGPGAPRG